MRSVVCNVVCGVGDMILTYTHGGDRLVTVVTSKRLAMGGSRKKQQVSRSSRACPLPGTEWLQPFPWSKVSVETEHTCHGRVQD